MSSKPSAPAPTGSVATKILQCLEQNPSYTQAQIANAVGASKVYACRVLARHNRRARQTDYAKQALTMHAAEPNLSATAIARRLGCTDSTVIKALASATRATPRQPTKASVASRHIRAVASAWETLSAATTHNATTEPLADAVQSAIDDALEATQGAAHNPRAHL